MDRVFLSIGNITIYWYSILIAVSVLIGLYFAPKYAEKIGIGKDFILNMVFYLIPICIIGARLYYVIFNFSVFEDDLLSIFKIWEGGLAIYGVVISAIIFIYFYTKKYQKNFFLTLDVLVPYLILGQSIGRWGNFINKEAHGIATTLEHLQALHLPNFVIKGMNINGTYYIPTFFYESIFCFLGFLIIIYIRKRDKFKHPGLLLSIYAIWYGIVRFFIEGMRTDSLYLGIFRISQIVSIILVVLGIIGLIILLRREKCNAKV